MPSQRLFRISHIEHIDDTDLNVGTHSERIPQAEVRVICSR